jgi:hypothetical protein
VCLNLQQSVISDAHFAAAVCAPGFVEEGSGSSSRCVQCPKGNYCRGGNGNGASAEVGVSTNTTNEDTFEDGLLGGARSYNISCGTAAAITTSVRGSTSEAACGELQPDSAEVQFQFQNAVSSDGSTPSQTDAWC